MDQENTVKQQAQMCGCGGPKHGKQQHPASETKSHDEPRVGSMALDILDERFARGEIERAEYEEKKHLISQRAGPPNADGLNPDPTPHAAPT